MVLQQRSAAEFGEFSDEINVLELDIAGCSAFIRGGA